MLNKSCYVRSVEAGSRSNIDSDLTQNRSVDKLDRVR